MKNSKSTLSLAAFVSALVLNGMAQSAAPAAAATPLDPGTVKSSIDLIRSDIKTEKAYLIAQNLTLTADESDEFWPLYNDYNAALNVLLDERLALIKDYLDQHETMTNEQATTLADKLFAWEAKRLELKRTWFKKFTKVVPATKAAKFYQVENQINAALDLKLMDSMPLIK